MNPAQNQRNSLLYVAIALSAGAVFSTDLVLSLGISIWVFYLVPLSLSLFAWRPRTPLLVAAGCTAFIVIALLLSPRSEDHPERVSQINRTFGIATLWAVALMARQAVLSRLLVQQRDWLKQGQSSLAACVQGEQKEGELGDSILRSLCEYLDAPVGVFYIARKDGSLGRVASYALSPDHQGREVIAPGEGLIGQAIKDNRPLRLDNIPKGYLPVSSALGQVTPRNLVVVPSAIDGSVQGAIELGFLRKVDATDMELLGGIAGAVAVAIRSLQYRTRLVELLAETQRQAEELQTQQKEVEESNVELEEQAYALEHQRDDLRRTQAHLIEKADELARTNQYKSEFLANMSHELRTPLNSALILSQLLADNKDGNLSGEQVRYAATIHSAGNDLLTLIDDILDLSRIEAGRMEVHPEAVDIGRVVESLSLAFQPAAEQKGLSFRCVIEPGTPAPVTTDPLRLQQVLRNLLSNAIKFTDKGEVSLRIWAEGGDRIAFAVRDTGVGILRAKQEIIFEAFRQADGSTQRQYGGTGLGLTISRELSSRLGGELKVDSAPGKGSTFTLILPVRLEFQELEEPAPVRPAPAPESPAPAPVRTTLTEVAGALDDDRDLLTGGDRSILVIEDDPRFARILCDLSRELGFRCLIASTAAGGMSLAERYQPSAIVLDIQLPDHSGLTVLEQLKRTAATRHIPVHIISVSDYAQQALEMGAVGHALKPIKREHLVRAFERLERKLEQKIRRVLVVEDVKMQRDSIVHLLTAEDVEVTAVGTGREGQELMRDTLFDCVVLDLRLPDMSGFDLLDRMATDEGFSFPPVIVYTGRSLSRDDEVRLRRYASSIVIKGARSPERLLDEVTLFLHQVEARLPPEQQRILKEVRHREAVFEGRRILLVEDDVRNVFALVNVLEPRGARVEIARNGREALDALERASDPEGAAVDLVLMDIMMPEMDGLTATHEIRKRPEWKKLPVIALTAKAMPDDREQCIEAGVNDYITKPIDIDKLLSLIRVWMPK